MNNVLASIPSNAPPTPITPNNLHELVQQQQQRQQEQQEQQQLEQQQEDEAKFNQSRAEFFRYLVSRTWHNASASRRPVRLAMRFHFQAMIALTTLITLIALVHSFDFRSVTD